MIVSVPKVAGDYPMGLMRNISFVVGSDNKAATDGRIVVTSVTPTTLTGGLVDTYDAPNNVNGQFTLTCAPRATRCSRHEASTRQSAFASVDRRPRSGTNRIAR